jgi:hypothetical protein
MKNESPDWMERLHEMRREEEERRIREGVSMVEWLRRVDAEADAVIAELGGDGQPLLARDKSPSGSQP